VSQGPGEDLRPALGTVEQQSPFGNATQQAQEAASQPEVVALNNCMELRRKGGGVQGGRKPP
jgi:hypothetical protein